MAAVAESVVESGRLAGEKDERTIVEVHTVAVQVSRLLRSPRVAGLEAPDPAHPEAPWQHRVSGEHDHVVANERRRTPRVALSAGAGPADVVRSIDSHRRIVEAGARRAAGIRGVVIGARIGVRHPHLRSRVEIVRELHRPGDRLRLSVVVVDVDLGEVGVQSRRGLRPRGARRVEGRGRHEHLPSAFVGEVELGRPQVDVSNRVEVVGPGADDVEGQLRRAREDLIEAQVGLEALGHLEIVFPERVRRDAGAGLAAGARHRIGRARGAPGPVRRQGWRGVRGATPTPRSVSASTGCTDSLALPPSTNGTVP